MCNNNCAKDGQCCGGRCVDCDCPTEVVDNECVRYEDLQDADDQFVHDFDQRREE